MRTSRHRLHVLSTGLNVIHWHFSFLKQVCVLLFMITYWLSRGIKFRDGVVRWVELLTWLFQLTFEFLVQMLGHAIQNNGWNCAIEIRLHSFQLRFWRWIHFDYSSFFKINVHIFTVIALAYSTILVSFKLFLDLLIVLENVEPNLFDGWYLSHSLFACEKWSLVHRKLWCPSNWIRQYASLLLIWSASHPRGVALLNHNRVIVWRIENGGFVWVIGD